MGLLNSGEMEEVEKKSIEIILESISETAAMIAGCAPEIEEINDETTTAAVDHYTIIMGIMGNFEGQIILSLKDEVISKIASTMNGMEFQEIDELALSSVIEFVNMVSGAATIKLVDYYDSEKLNMAPPVLIKGYEMIVSSKIKFTKTFLFKMAIGEIYVRIALEAVHAAK